MLIQREEIDRCVLRSLYMMRKQIPDQVARYFWGDDLYKLSWNKHRRYIMQTLLEIGDAQSISWLLKKSSVQEIKKILPTLALSLKSKNFWDIYFS